MRLAKLMLTGAAVAMAATPVMAANPAAPLSVSTASARASAPEGKSKLAGGGFLPLIAIAAVAAVILISASNDGSPNSP